MYHDVIRAAKWGEGLDTYASLTFLDVESYGLVRHFTYWVNIGRMEESDAQLKGKMKEGAIIVDSSSCIIHDMCILPHSVT